MSTISFEDVSLMLERLRNNFEVSSITNHSFLFPDAKIDTSLVSSLPGISTVSAQYAANISYDQDVFSELPMKVFSESHNAQMASFMKAFKDEFISQLSNKPKATLPKFYYHFDDVDSVEIIRLSSEWAEGNAMLYFSFEKAPSESNFGYVWNDSKKKNYQTRSGSIFLNNRADIIHETVEFVLRVY